jgi:hypothetical protein
MNQVNEFQQKSKQMDVDDLSSGISNIITDNRFI